jgi:hypothetical protein
VHINKHYYYYSEHKLSKDTDKYLLLQNTLIHQIVHQLSIRIRMINKGQFPIALLPGRFLVCLFFFQLCKFRIDNSLVPGPQAF